MNTHTPQRPNQEWRGTAGTRAQAHIPTPHTPARSGGVQAGRAHKHTHAPTSQSGVAGRRCNPSPSTHSSQEGQGTRLDAHTNTHTPQHLIQGWPGAAQTPAQAHTPTSHTRAGNSGVQAERAHNHARPKKPANNGGVQAKTEALLHTPQTPARNAGAKPQPVPKRTHPSPQPGLEGLPKPEPKHNPEPNTNATQQ